MRGWLGSAGFTPTRVEAWPEAGPSRALVNATVTPGIPEYLQVSYERPLQITTVTDWDGVSVPTLGVVPAGDGSESPELPVPPLEMRVLVGPTDVSAFDNPTGDPVFAGVDLDLYDSVVDFGCGCGRVARQLIQQRVRPRRYIGIDLHRGMVEWCRANLAPHASGFEFFHHDVLELGFNPGPDKPLWAPLPVADDTCSMFIAHSVFTHVMQDHAVSYLRELRRVLRPGGVALTTWFLFDKRDFPMMQVDQNALFINSTNPTNAVIFDREWLVATLAEVGLVAAVVHPPTVRGFQWLLHLVDRDAGVPAAEFPPDTAPIGVVRAQAGSVAPHLVGVDDRPASDGSAVTDPA